MPKPIGGSPLGAKLSESGFPDWTISEPQAAFAFHRRPRRSADAEGLAPPRTGPRQLRLCLARPAPRAGAAADSSSHSSQALGRTRASAFRHVEILSRYGRRFHVADAVRDHICSIFKRIRRIFIPGFD
jgi:hypothetical protein